VHERRRDEIVREVDAEALDELFEVGDREGDERS
jgi:hypothetical protein